MTIRIALTACALAIAASQPAMAQNTGFVGYGDNPAPVPQNVPDPKDSPEEIAKDAARDLKEARFYNKPGATRAQYDADWQACRLIARGSRTPSGMIPYSYNPAVISPVAAGIGAGIGGAIGAAIVQGQQRRDNRRACLLTRGWRLVEVDPAEAARVAAMVDADRNVYVDALVGAVDVKGKITELKSFALAADPALRLDTALTQPGAMWRRKKTQAPAPVALQPGEGAIVVGYRRVEQGAAGRSAAVELLRYDAEGRDILYRPKDWKKRGDTTTYSLLLESGDRNAVYEVEVRPLTPGDYVINSLTVGNAVATTTHCFGAPTFRVNAGEILYLGDFVPFMGVKLSSGEKFSGVAYASHVKDARRTLAAFQRGLAGALKPATLRNRASYGCSGITMTRWDIAGLDAVPEPVAPETVASNAR